MIEETTNPNTVDHPDTPGCVASVAAAVCVPSNEPHGEPRGGEAGGGGGGSGWLSGMWSTARSQSANVIGFMRRDLGEFVSTVRTDTKEVVQRTAGVVRDSVNRDTANEASSKLKSGLNRFLDTISSAMVIPPDDSEEETLVYREGDWHPAKSRREGRILSLQNDPKTFEEAPDDEAYKAWVQSFDVDALKTQISDLLISSAAIRAVYTRLVPNTLLHREFWARYFFRLQKVEIEEDRWAALKERAGRKDASTNDWGEDWDEETPQPRPADVEDRSAPQERPDEVVERSETDVEERPKEKGEEPARDVQEQFKVTEKEDVVVVKHKDSPESSSEGSASSGVPENLAETQERPEAADSKDLEEWEADLDVEVTAEEIEAAKRTAREMKDANELDDDEDWENWE